MLQGVQHPLVVIRSGERQPPLTAAEREGHAMHAAAAELRRIALTLPASSPAREQMLASAQHWQTGAQLRGVTPQRLHLL